MSSLSASVDAKVHLLAIRKALANRSAAVMVGAGFSRNAEGGENLATWRELTSTLSLELEPGKEVENHSPGAAAQLAEQYARVFSPAQLEQLIKRCVPDDQVSPGKLHSQLLELPWSEVFTTNYDTLLERAAERVFEVSYFTVCSREDIPQSKVLGRRRIVKLHGSFPSHRPFILTEEEYRTYPERFAPFVNMVRQSLLENVFCLIGFSGDDPNFLHWLGWVRDMLDKHALPVYLFLAREPTLGERKLYEARGVVPVVLPESNDAAPEDFRARYKLLFDVLAAPLENSPLDWGNVSHYSPLSAQGGDEERFAMFLERVSEVIGYRESYPGWIVAPKKVRMRIKSASDWIEEALSEAWLRTLLGECQSDLALSVIDCYCWTQRIVLGPLLDSIAEVGLKALLAPERGSTKQHGPAVAKIVSLLLPSDGRSVERMRKSVGMALLTWARQSHHTKQFLDVKTMLEGLCRADAAVLDHLIYEDILSNLQRADRPSALALARRWRPAPANAYAHVLRGAILAELDDVSAAIATLGQAIQTLRRQQRSRPNDPKLISQEAWACLVARHLHDAEAFFARFGRVPAESDWGSSIQAGDMDDPMDAEDLNDRLATLITRGYSAEDELNHFAARLNAEASPPSPALRNLVGFDIGTSSSQHTFGLSFDLRNKLSASFEWLELLERVGLPHRTRNASFYSDEMLQAAWWARFGDTPERSTGLLLRAHRNGALKPRDGYGRPHRTGWLNRYEIANLKQETAADLARSLIRQIVAELQDGGPAIYERDRGQFLIEAFGRLALRVEDSEEIRRWVDDFVALHAGAALQAQADLWAPASEAMGRLVEALPPDMKESAVLDIFRLPLCPAAASNRGNGSHYIESWVDVHKILRDVKFSGERARTAEWGAIAVDLISQLRLINEPGTVSRIWARVHAMRWLGVLSDEYQLEAGDILWKSVPKGGWPTIPGQYPSASLNWARASQKVSSLLLDKLLDSQFDPFGAGPVKYHVKDGGRVYALGGAEGAIGQIYSAVSAGSPTLSQISKIFAGIEEWLVRRRAEVIADMQVPDIRAGLEDVCDNLDKIISCCLDVVAERRSSSGTKVLERKALVIVYSLEAFSFAFVRSRIRLSEFDRESSAKLLDDAKMIVRAIADGNPSSSALALQRSYALLTHPTPGRLDRAGRLIFDALASSIITKRAQSLPNILNMLSHLPKNSWRRYASPGARILIETGLSGLQAPLSYSRDESIEHISRELVPNLRFYVLRLSYVMIEIVGIDCPAARAWLEAAKDDPLPEVRHGRYKLMH